MKLAKTPSVPIQFGTLNWYFRMSPIGEARFVTNEIIPKRKIITMIGRMKFCFFSMKILKLG